MDPVRYLVGTGVEGFRPPGYKTIDISADHNPDIVANAAELPMIKTGSADEFYASHVLEHFSWPRAILVLAEWARVLKIGGVLKVAVPDMELYAHRILHGPDVDDAMMGVYGAHWVGDHGEGEGGPQGHHYGYTRRSLVNVLRVMGFDDFRFWRSDMEEASNHWIQSDGDERLGMSLNLMCGKKRAPLFDPRVLYKRLRYHDLTAPFMGTVRKMLIEENRLSDIPEIDAVLFQRLNQQYMTAEHLRKHLESELSSARAEIARLTGQR